jgi:hypothetical protein
MAAKWNYSDRRKTESGRPPVPQEIRELILHLANENPSWRYDCIQGAMGNLESTFDSPRSRGYRSGLGGKNHEKPTFRTTRMVQRPPLT